MIHHGDCLEVMAGIEPESVDAVVTDPPYGLEFMGKAWDSFKETGNFPGGGKPGPKGGAWATAAGVNSKGFDGYPPVPRFFAGRPYQDWCQQWAEAAYRVAKPSAYLLAFGGTRTVHRMTVAIEDAGWIIRDMLVWAYASGFPKSKASLKPAWEPIVMARKPGPLRMLAIDECRIEAPEGSVVSMTYSETGAARGMGGGLKGGNRQDPQTLGRWPANVILTEAVFGAEYSRFFLIPKADRADREPVLGGLPEGLGPVIDQARRGRCVDCGRWKERAAPNICPCGGAYEFESNAPKVRQNVHPTVKPVDLMRHLIRLVTPTGGTVLDPFLGSGTTAIAAEMEGFDWIGIEKEAEYVAIAEARLNGTQRGLGLPA